MQRATFEFRTNWHDFHQTSDSTQDGCYSQTSTRKSKWTVSDWPNLDQVEMMNILEWIAAPDWCSSELINIQVKQKHDRRHEVGRFTLLYRCTLFLTIKIFIFLREKKNAIKLMWVIQGSEVVNHVGMKDDTYTQLAIRTVLLKTSETRVQCRKLWFLLTCVWHSLLDRNEKWIFVSQMLPTLTDLLFQPLTLQENTRNLISFSLHEL